MPTHKVVLVTDRHLERGVTFYGNDRAALVKLAGEWIEAQGRGNDHFELFETKPVLIGSIFGTTQGLIQA